MERLQGRVLDPPQVLQPLLQADQGGGDGVGAVPEERIRILWLSMPGGESFPSKSPCEILPQGAQSEKGLGEVSKSGVTFTSRKTDCKFGGTFKDFSAVCWEQDLKANIDIVVR